MQPAGEVGSAPLLGGQRASRLCQGDSSMVGDIREVGLVPGLGRSPGGGYGNPLQYSGLENPMDRGAWQAMVHTVERVGQD